MEGLCQLWVHWDCTEEELVSCRFCRLYSHSRQRRLIHREGLIPSSLPPLYDTDRDDDNYSDTQPNDCQE